MLNEHLLIIWIIEEDILIFYNVNKVIEAVRSDLQIRPEDLWVVDLIILHNQA